MGIKGKVSMSDNILTKMVGKNGFILALFAAICVGLISTTYFVTRDKIASQEEQSLIKTLDQLVEKSKYDNDVYNDCTLIENAELLGSNIALKAYRMRKNQQPVAVSLESIAPNGYSGKISMVVGIYYNGTIAGVRITQHSETPGLGDKIEVNKSDWIKDFNNKSLQNPLISKWQVKKDGGDFDAFTGATITPRAVVTQVAKTLQFYQDNKTSLFTAKNNCERKSES